MSKYSKLNIVNSHLNYDHVSLIEPTTHYYLHVAAHIDTPWSPFFFFESDLKKKAIKKCKQFSDELVSRMRIVESNVFKALLTPPGRSKFIAENKEKIQVAKFDIALLIEVKSESDLEAVMKDVQYLELIDFLKKNTIHMHCAATNNARRINNVDHSRQGVFLFNYFYALDVEQNLEVWNYTAGWFQKETGLDNSTLLLPLKKSDADYTVINHCRWDNLRAILPSLIFKPSFNTYVLDNFYENNVGAMPILYKIVK